MSDDPHTHLIPYDADPLDRLARLVLEQNGDRLPDLTNCIVLFPGSATNQRFRRALLEAAAETGFTALIPPTSGGLGRWLTQFRQPEVKVLGQSERELLLLEALEDFPDLTRRYGTWPLVDSLFSLFDELTLNRFPMPSDADEFTQTIKTAYGGEALKPLGNEASLVHTLWQAWQARLGEIAAQDPPMAHATALKRSIDHLGENDHIYLAGFLRFNRAELEWIRTLRQSHRIDLIFHGDAVDEPRHPAMCVAQSLRALDLNKALPSRSEYSDFLDNVFHAPETPLAQRAAKQHRRVATSPAHGRLQVCAADHPEQEARVIDIQVRRWLLDGIRSIGIVTNDRRLARRVRALLERADVMLVDTAGWTLSTTSAASAVIHWLECIELRFHHARLPDCLKSPFLTTFVSNFGGLELVDQFEQTVIHRYGVTGELDRYRATVENHRDYIDETCGEYASSRMLQMLDALANAVQPLAAAGAAGPVAADKYFAALEATLSALGLTDTLSRDGAGKAVLDEIRELRYCCRNSRLTSNHEGFVSWLMRNLERREFKPPSAGNSGVELMGLAESRLCRFDALVVAGVTSEHLPGSAADSPFFNEGVRHQLDLPSRYLPQRERFADFRRLLEAGKHILLTLPKEQDGNPVIASPWVERLQAFHTLAYRAPLDAPELVALASDPRTLIHRDTAEAPEPDSAPEIRIDPALLPQKISATAYQKLVDCPFSFFANYCLALVPLEEIGDELDKADYGSRIHRILQAFHGGVAGLPGPFGGPLTEATLDAATALLSQISEEVFRNDIRRLPSTRGWYYSWQRAIPHYLDWQLEREKQWRVTETETDHEIRLLEDPPMRLAGRLDRVETGNGKYAIIDYKTGRAPTKAGLQNGESVQLPFYAMLGEPLISVASALEIGDSEVNERGRIEDEELAQLVADHSDRLKNTYTALASGANAPAWANPDICRRCRHAGICRRELWEKDYAAN